MVDLHGKTKWKYIFNYLFYFNFFYKGKNPLAIRNKYKFLGLEAQG